MISAAGLGYGYVRYLVGIDPFAKLGTERDLDGVAIKLEDVEMKRWSEGKLVAQAHIGEVDVQQNRQLFDLSKITNGVYYGEEGKIEFEADAAKWNNSTLQLMIDSNARVKSEDFDLAVTEFNFDQRASTLSVPSGIKGTLKGGEIAAREFKYNTKTGTYSIGATKWTGETSIEIQEGQSTPRSKWTFETAGVLSAVKGIETAQFVKATDGEIWVSGDKSERNQKTDVLTVTGNVLYFSPKANIACEKIVIYRTEKRAIATGQVRMMIKPKDSMEKELKLDLSTVPGEVPPFRPMVPDSVQANRPNAPQSEEEKQLDEEVRSGKSSRKYPTVVLTEKIEFWYAKGSRRADIPGDVQARQELAGGRWRQAWSSSAKYDGEKELLRLIGSATEPVRYASSIEDKFLAMWFEFSTKEDADIQEYTGEGVRGDFSKTEDDPSLEGETPP